MIRLVGAWTLLGALAIALSAHAQPAPSVQPDTAIQAPPASPAAPVARPAPTAPAQAHPAPRVATPLIEASPTWAELNANQQTALNPLKKLWPEINQAQKRKWLAVSRNYHDLPEQEQLTMHARMRDWVRMDSRERSQARLEYARAQTLSVDERRARWEAYLALSEEERRQLARHNPRQPKGAAIALRPVAAPKINPPPAAQTQKPYHQGFSALRIDTDQIHPRTLLPLNVPGHASP
jgi:hypothetical protein